jgi:hypothetical protein
MSYLHSKSRTAARHARLRRKLSRRVPAPLGRRLAQDAENEMLRGRVGVRNAWVR